MLLSHLKKLCITSALLIATSPLATAFTIALTARSLPNTLQQAVPTCAQSCLQASLVENFPVACSGQDGIQCLCSRYNNIGQTLGETALACVYSNCPGVDRKTTSSVYNICLNVDGAVSPTKTAVASFTTIVARPTSASSQSMATITSLAISTLQTQFRSTQSVFVDSISVAPSATSTATSVPTAAARTAEVTPRLTPAQIAGLSVAAVAAFIFAVGLMALSVCLRRRKEQKYSSFSDEKEPIQPHKKRSKRVTNFVPAENGREPPKRFPVLPASAVTKVGQYSVSNSQTSAGRPAARPVQRFGVGTSNNSSNSSVPSSQIGLAISAELDGTPVVGNEAANPVPIQQRNDNRLQLNSSLRPVSTMTQCTVFEEDDLPARRRSSLLLPTPPVPIAPIRNLQPSRQRSELAAKRRESLRRSELFLDIPVRHERPQPRRIITADMPTSGSPKRPELASRNRLAPPIQMTPSASYESKATTASSRGPSNSGDISDYYITTTQGPTPRASPAKFTRQKEMSKAMQVKPKHSLSTVSGRTSRASSNIRDSLSSATSFETADPNDPTPEEDDDDDKQLSDDNKQQLSPVAESPISNLRYPKIPRASNQLVPRSPRSPQNLKSPSQVMMSPRRPPEHATVIQTRRHNLPPPLLESRPRLKTSPKDSSKSPPRKPRGHFRSNSTESWTATPASKIERQSRVQSGAWGKSPVMYEEDVVKPLNVRRRGKQGEMMEVNVGRDVSVDELMSPVWVPKLTPTRKGDDLFISVGWGTAGRP